MANTLVTHVANEYTVATNTSSSINLNTYGKPRKVTYIVSATLGSSATVDGTVTACATSNGTYTTIASISQLTSSGSTYIVAEIPDSYNYLKTTITVGTAASKVCAILVFDNERYPMEQT